MALVASFHLTRERTAGSVATMAAMLRPARLAPPVAGLRFARRLGTGRGRAMGVHADLRRWALFAVWEDEGALDAFLGDHPLPRRWRERSAESWAVRLAPLTAHGTWGGSDPFAGIDDVAAHRLAIGPGPVAVLTRATVPVRHWRSFHRAVPGVERQLLAADGLLEAAGVGERPVGSLATFSLWRSSDHVDAFAYGGSDHHRVVQATRHSGWFREELFARFRPYSSTGTWTGRNPLEPATAERPVAAGNGS